MVLAKLGVTMATWRFGYLAVFLQTREHLGFDNQEGVSDENSQHRVVFLELAFLFQEHDGPIVRVPLRLPVIDVTSRGFIKAKAVVTKRLMALRMGNRTVHQIGIPIHWGFTGATRKGFGANMLTPYVGDANIETPEYKAFLVDIEPISGPVA
jgi:hypothetical protein